MSTPSPSRMPARSSLPAAAPKTWRFGLPQQAWDVVLTEVSPSAPGLVATKGLAGALGLPELCYLMAESFVSGGRPLRSGAVNLMGAVVEECVRQKAAGVVVEEGLQVKLTDPTGVVLAVSIGMLTTEGLLLGFTEV